jgi:two-component system chemotaxis response regulator CheB
MQAGHDIIVIGASAGGVEALTELVSNLPPDLPAAVFVVLHFPTFATSTLPRILSRAGQLPAAHAEEGQKIQPGQIYVAPPNRHMLLNQNQVRLIIGPREHGFRPAIDPLFHSAARVFGPRALGVILSGTMSDGAVGIAAIKRSGGATLAQDPKEAAFSTMPMNAMRTGMVDQVLPVSGLAEEMNRLAREVQEIPDTGGNSMSDQNEIENDLVQQDIKDYEKGKDKNSRTVLTCPECGGVLWELEEDNLLHFRCHVGHVYSDESLYEGQIDELESALWTAVRMLEERAALDRRLALQATERGHSKTETRFREQAEDAERSAAMVRKLLQDGRLTNGLEADLES